MNESYTMQPIAHVHTDFGSKFAVPRQSGLVRELRGEIVFAPGFRQSEALRGIEGFSHLWLLWVFSANVEGGWSPTVRPPRLGGNTRMGVFATRSPFRPNPIGLSCVELIGAEERGELGTVLRIAGADLMDGTPILDIKPYIRYSDSLPESRGGWMDDAAPGTLPVDCAPELLEKLPPDRRAALLGVLAQDPRPAYQHGNERVYGFPFAGFDVRFRVKDGRVEVVELRDL